MDPGVAVAVGIIEQEVSTHYGVDLQQAPDFSSPPQERFVWPFLATDASDEEVLQDTRARYLQALQTCQVHDAVADLERTRGSEAKEMTEALSAISSPQLYMPEETHAEIHEAKIASGHTDTLKARLTWAESQVARGVDHEAVQAAVTASKMRSQPFRGSAPASAQGKRTTSSSGPRIQKLG